MRISLTKYAYFIHVLFSINFVLNYYGCNYVVRVKILILELEIRLPELRDKTKNYTEI